MACFTT